MDPLRVDSDFRCITYRFKLMGSPCQFILYTQQPTQQSQIVQQVLAELRELEQMFSRYRADSWLSQVNQAAGSGQPVAQTSVTLAWVRYADQAYQQTAGLFDATAGVLAQAWNFKQQRLPDPAQINRLLPLVGWSKVEWDEQSIYLPVTGMQLDFGGFGKEYAADLAANRLRALGVQFGLVDLGGDLAVVGCHPDQRPWRIGIRDPLQNNRDQGNRVQDSREKNQRPICQISLSQGGLATSGMYERCIKTATACYGHILHPGLGWPLADTWASVTVLAPHCLVAGTASTVSLLRSPPEAQEWLDELGLPYVLVGARGDIVQHTDLYSEM